MPRRQAGEDGGSPGLHEGTCQHHPLPHTARDGGGHRRLQGENPSSLRSQIWRPCLLGDFC